ncbi:MAG: DUF4012 domain-containing protein [bacterium]|nr:DUF4012 domain-containing protein [bacterium]
MKSSPSSSKKSNFFVWLVSILLTLILLAVAFCLWWQNQNYTSLILLQNTDEKRATGGFLGSIAVVRHHGWQIDNWQIYDIYESDGQIQEFLPAPPAAAQYLSDGKNELHLPDSNWERDFPTSSRKIVELFMRAGRPRPDFVISLNLPVIEKLIDKIGGLHFNSEATTSAQLLTSENFAAQARAQRADFFPGDTQKTDFLRPTAAALLSQAEQFSLKKKITFLRFFAEEAQNHQLYSFSFNQHWQKLFQLLGISGETQLSKNCQQIYWVESNVGVNKSNRLVERFINLEKMPTQLKINVSWQNNNPNILSPDSSWRARRHYANYQRLLLPLTVNLETIEVDGQAPTQIDRREITDDDGERWQEIGFLLIVNEQASSSATVILNQTEFNCWQVDFN